jgi:peptidoglycan/xylan/chitin deacetylase (PgdA/CDA1 family)
MHKMLRNLLILTFVLLPGHSISQVLSDYRKTDEKSGKSYNDIDSYVIDNGYKHKTITLPPGLFHHIPGLTGPEKPTLLSPRNPVSWKKYEAGGSNRLCIYLRDTNSFWIGLVQGMMAHRIPFRITTDIKEAVKHRVMIAYPALTSANLDQKSFIELRKFVQSGGALIGFNLFSPALGELFGFTTSVFNNKRDRVNIDNEVSELVSFVEDPLEKSLRIGNFKVLSTAFETCGYTGLEYKPLAEFSDGSGAIIRKLYNKGAAYGFGLDVGFFTLFCQANLDPVYQNTYVNGFEPTVDVFFRIIRNIYMTHETVPITPGKVPGNKSVAISLTHDVDTKDAIPNALLYADLEQKNGVSATYFIQTKYIKDGQDDHFFTVENIPYMDALLNMGMEVGSHTVSHTPFFSYLPLGSGTEKYPDYQPFYVTNFSTFNETLLGELRVSKFLLDHFLNINTISFRTGYLGHSVEMYPALEATGYSYSSCVTANDVLSHMPFQCFYDNKFDSPIEVYEFPITIEDEEAPQMDRRVSSAIFLTNKIAGYGGFVNILIHPNERIFKYAFESAYIDHFKDEAWMGTMKDYGMVGCPF